MRCKHKRHGHTRNGKWTAEYRCWAEMISRTTNPARKDFPRYGGQGVTVCAQWRESFEAFFSYIGPKPTPQHSIDRIDNSRGYEPDNVRWATIEEQNQNKRNNVNLTINGETHCVSKWAEISGVHVETIRSRLRTGMDAPTAVFQRPRRASQRRAHAN